MEMTDPTKGGDTTGCSTDDVINRPDPWEESVGQASNTDPELHISVGKDSKLRVNKSSQKDIATTQQIGHPSDPEQRDDPEQNGFEDISKAALQDHTLGVSDSMIPADPETGSVDKDGLSGSQLAQHAVVPVNEKVGLDALESIAPCARQGDRTAADNPR